MHDMDPKFQIFGSHVGATDINQGALGDCYLLAAFAGLADIDNGYYIRNLFETKVFPIILSFKKTIQISRRIVIAQSTSM